MQEAFFRKNYGHQLPESKDAKILDLGCGVGALLSLLHKAGYEEIEGVDIDPEAIALVPASVQEKAKLVTDTVAYLTAHAGSFDRIFCKEMIYYLPREKAPAFLLLLYASLKPGGKLVLTAFNGALLSAPYTAAKDSGILTFYTEHSLRELAERSGFCVEAVFGEEPERKGWKYFLYSLGRGLWCRVLALIYLLERGRDENNPRLFAKSLVLVARKPKISRSEH